MHEKIKMTNQKVVITGGNGGMAKAIAELLTKERYNVKNPGRDKLDITNFITVCKYMEIEQPDILINVAGFIKPNKIKDTKYWEWHEHINVNLTGAFYCIHYAIKYGCNTVINIGSTSAFEGREGWGAYCASKAGLMSLTESLAKEGVNSYGLHPSRTKTKMREKLFPDEDQKTLMPPERIAEFVLKILNKEFKNGSHIIVKKDNFIVLPSRECPK